MTSNENSRMPAAVLAAGLALGGGWLYLKYFKAQPSAPLPPSSDLGARPSDGEKPPPSVPLDLSDGRFRDETKQLMIGSAAEGWLQNENLVRRVAAATSILAEGGSPRDSLAFLAPAKPFTVIKKGNKTLLDEKSYSRYDSIGNTLADMNAADTAKTVQRLMPMFQAAYRELGSPKADFQSAWLGAVNQLLGTPRVSGPIEVRRRVTTYVFVDERLERLTAAQKHLLRTGPKNVARIQDKLREVSIALGVPADRLAPPQK